MPRKENEEITSLRRITKKVLRDLCKKNKLYQTPELNDVLYLHYQGFQDIECLEEYTGLKCLWLESNAISDIKGLDNQKELKCLFLHNNLIRKIENLESCKELDTLNLSNNHISRIENCGVDKLPVLTTLNLAHNYLKCVEDLQNLIECTQLSVLDLGNNRIEDILIVKILAKMPELRVLVLTGNPVVSRLPQYRKTLTLECKELTYLDSRPVFPRDRACAEAWKRGGYEEERREHERWNKAERKKIRDSVNATLRFRNRGGGDPQIDLIASSSDEDEGLTERSSAPAKEVLQNMSTEEVNAEIIELMRLGDLVEYEQNENCSKESANNEKDNEAENLKCKPGIINQAETLPETKIISANKCVEDTAMEENSQALEKYGKTYKQAYDNYLKYVQILMNQDHPTITSDKDKNNGDTAEIKVENNESCENDDNNSSESNLLPTVNYDQIGSMAELTKEGIENLELDKNSQEIIFNDIQSKHDVSTAEFVTGKIEDITDTEIELNQSEKVENSDLQTTSDSKNLQMVPEKERSYIKEEISISPMSYMECHSSLDSQTNNLSIPSYMFPKIIEDKENQLVSISDGESDNLEDYPEENREDKCKTECRTINKFILDYKQFLGIIDDHKSNEKKEIDTKHLNKVDVEKSSNTFVDVDSNSSFEKIRFFVQDSPEVEKEESRKLQIINRLLENPITKQMSTCNTLEELEEQLKNIEKEQTKWIQKVTDKCYSQRERYDDDLEVINDQLFVIKKDRNNTNDKVDKEGSINTNDGVDNAQLKDLNQVSNFTKIEEGLQNDNSQIYEMASFICEENPNERIEKCLEEYNEEKNYTSKENLAKMVEYEPNSLNNEAEEYFVPATSSPQKGQFTDTNTGIISTLENISEEKQKCYSSDKEIPLILEVNLEKEPKYNFYEKETGLHYDSTRTLETNSEKEVEQCNSFKNEIELQYDSAEIPSTSKVYLETQRKCNLFEKGRDSQYNTTKMLSTLEVIAEEVRQCNSSEKEIEPQFSFETISSTSKACLGKQQTNNFDENDGNLKCNVTEDGSILEDHEKFYIFKKENIPQYNAAEIPFTLEASSEKGQKYDFPIEKLDLGAAGTQDDQYSDFKVKELGNSFENFEWIKSSILTLASSGIEKGSRDTGDISDLIYSPDSEINKIHRDIDDDFHKDLTSLFINASLEYKMIESAQKYGDPEKDSPFDIEQRVQWYLEELKNYLPPEIKEMVCNENKNWYHFNGNVDEFKNSNNLDESPHIKRLHEILQTRNTVPGVVDKSKILLKLVLANKDYLLNHEKPEARELAKRILKDNGIEDPDTDSASTEVNLSNTSTELMEDKFAFK